MSKICSFESWKKKVSSKYGCDKEVEAGGNYCQKHGCIYCSCKNKGEFFSCVDGKSLVCWKERCKKRDKEKLMENNAEKKSLEKEDKNVRSLLLGFNKKFSEDISEILDRLKVEKLNVIDKNVRPTVIIPEEIINNFFVKIIEDYTSVLTDDEIKRWKNSYQGKGGNLDRIIAAEKETLRKLAKERRKKQADDKQRERERERERANLIISEIQTELNLSPSINITELASQYHNYENWKADELTNEKDNIIQAIKNKRIEKQLLELLNQANSSSDSELWNFIQKLEELSTATSPTENQFYATHQSWVDTILNNLKQRWNNLDEAKKLTSYWNKAITDFENWLKEAEDLQLTSEDPFFSFKQDIKNFKTQVEIAEQEQKVKDHILAKFKVEVKEKLGTEQQTNEYQELDNAETFEAVKAARNSIFQRRQDPNSPPIPPQKKDDNKNKPSDNPDGNNDKNGGGNRDDEENKDKKNQKTSTNNTPSSNLTTKMLVGMSILVAGAVITMVVIKVIQKRLKKRKSVK